MLAAGVAPVPPQDLPSFRSMSETPTPAPEAAAPAKPKKLLVIVLAVVGLAAGTGAGAFVAAPLLAGKSASAATPAGSEKKKGEHGEEKAGEKAEAAAPIIYLMENIVLNPAGTSGTRFLMATIAVELSDAKYVDRLKERDAEARDVLVSLLGRKTVDELSDATRRDAFRAEANAAIAPLLPKKAVKRVFFPQFVIQ